MSLDDAVEWRNNLQKRGIKLVMTNGCFDILHRGHASYLMKARAFGGALLLAINSDNSVRQLKGPSRPVNNEFDRAYLLSCLPFIDAVVVFNTAKCTGIIDKIKPDVYVKGADYTLNTMDQEEKKALEKVGTEIRFIEFVDGYSSSKIIEKIASK
jgi:rfaE bifunctional protein nucleotidyltransferase chain/domain